MEQHNNTIDIQQRIYSSVFNSAPRWPGMSTTCSGVAATIPSSSHRRPVRINSSIHLFFYSNCSQNGKILRSRIMYKMISSQKRNLWTGSGYILTACEPSTVCGNGPIVLLGFRVYRWTCMSRLTSGVFGWCLDRYRNLEAVASRDLRIWHAFFLYRWV